MLSLSLFVENFRLGLLNFDFSIVIELFDHIAIHLNVVPFGFDLTYFLLVKFKVGL